MQHQPAENSGAITSFVAFELETDSQSREYVLCLRRQDSSAFEVARSNNRQLLQLIAQRLAADYRLPLRDRLRSQGSAPRRV
jgi:hypothetical protein